MADSDTTSRRSLLGLAGITSLCCLGPGAMGVGAGSVVGAFGGDLIQIAVTVLALSVSTVLIRRRTGCSSCES